MSIVNFKTSITFERCEVYPCYPNCNPSVGAYESGAYSFTNLAITNFNIIFTFLIPTYILWLSYLEIVVLWLIIKYDF